MGASQVERQWWKCLTLEDKTNKLSQNFGHQLSTDEEPHPKRAQISTSSWQNPKNWPRIIINDIITDA